MLHPTWEGSRAPKLRLRLLTPQWGRRPVSEVTAHFTWFYCNFCPFVPQTRLLFVLPGTLLSILPSEPSVFHHPSLLDNVCAWDSVPAGLLQPKRFPLDPEVSATLFLACLSVIHPKVLKHPLLSITPDPPTHCFTCAICFLLIISHKLPS